MTLQDHLHYTDSKMNYHSKKYQLFYKKDCRCWRKANGHHVDSQEQKRQLTWTENKVGYCQFAMHGLMECYEIARGLKR